MVVHRVGSQHRVYYHCSAYARHWVTPPCTYRRFISGTWDDLTWDDVRRMLSDDALIERQPASETSQHESVGKLIRPQQFKITQAANKIARIQEGYEAGGIYTMSQASEKIAGQQTSIAKAQEEMRQLGRNAGQWLCDPWALDEPDILKTRRLALLPGVTPDPHENGRGLFSLGRRSAIARYLRAARTWGAQAPLSSDDVETLINGIVAAL